MKSRFLCIVLLILTFVLQAKARLNDYNETHPLLFGIDIDYPPLEYIDEEGNPKGLDIEFTKLLMERLGLPFTYSPNTWDNISGDVLSGRVDLAMMVYSTYRKDLTNYSRAIFRLYYQLIFHKDKKQDMDIRHLAGKSVAYMASRPIRDTLTKAGADLHEVTNLSQAAKDLSEGKYDAVICFRYQSKYLIDKYNLKNLDTEDLTLTPREYCYVSQDKELIEAINAELELMESEGLIDEVYGDVSSSFGGLRIPMWVWYLLMALVFVFLITFIVFQQRYQRKIHREMVRAQRSEQLKTVFLGNISHALRTPLNAIIGFSDVLDSEEGKMMTDADQHQLLQLINSNGRQLLYFINQLLELSEIEGSTDPLERVEVDVAAALRGYVEEYRHEAAPGVELRVEGDDKLVMHADERYLRIVVRHFLSNAIRHTEQGAITLRYFLADGGLHVEVQDTGNGLPEELKENIFSLLSDKSTFIQSEVPGLGLTICKAIVDRCGGRVGASSPDGGGTLFWLWTPVRKIED